MCFQGLFEYNWRSLCNLWMEWWLQDMEHTAMSSQNHVERAHRQGHLNSISSGIWCVFRSSILRQFGISISRQHSQALEPRHVQRISKEHNPQGPRRHCQPCRIPPDGQTHCFQLTWSYLETLGYWNSIIASAPRRPLCSRIPTVLSSRWLTLCQRRPPRHRPSLGFENRQKHPELPRSSRINDFAAVHVHWLSYGHRWWR